MNFVVELNINYEKIKQEHGIFIENSICSCIFEMFPKHYKLLIILLYIRSQSTKNSFKKV